MNCQRWATLKCTLCPSSSYVSRSKLKIRVLPRESVCPTCSFQSNFKVSSVLLFARSIFLIIVAALFHNASGGPIRSGPNTLLQSPAQRYEAICLQTPRTTTRSLSTSNIARGSSLISTNRQSQILGGDATPPLELLQERYCPGFTSCSCVSAFG